VRDVVNEPHVQGAVHAPVRPNIEPRPPRGPPSFDSRHASVGSHNTERTYSSRASRQSEPSLHSNMEAYPPSLPGSMNSRSGMSGQELINAIQHQRAEMERSRADFEEPIFEWSDSGSAKSERIEHPEYHVYAPQYIAPAAASAAALTGDALREHQQRFQEADKQEEKAIDMGQHQAELEKAAINDAQESLFKNAKLLTKVRENLLKTKTIRDIIATNNLKDVLDKEVAKGHVINKTLRKLILYYLTQKDRPGKARSNMVSDYKGFESFDEGKLFKELEGYDPDYKRELDSARQRYKVGNPKGKGIQSGTGGLYTDQILETMSKIPNFIGCVASDQFKTLLKGIKPHSRVGWISNLDTSAQSGSHWVAFVINGSDKAPDAHSILYFDPFGRDIPEIMLPDLKLLAEKIDPNNMLKLKISRVQHQDKSSTNCGYFSMKFIIDVLSRHQSFAEASGYKDRVEDKSGKYEKEIEAMKKKAPFSHLGGAQYQPEDEQQEGGDAVDGIKEIAKGIISLLPKAREGAPPSVRKFVEQHKDDTIISINVCRVPIISVIQKVINVLRKLTAQKQNAQYDKLFHLYCIITLKPLKGPLKSYKMERNQVFSIGPAPSNPANAECKPAKISKGVRFGEMINRAVKSSKHNFWIYDSVNNNCQDAMLSILRSAGNSDSGIQSFVKVDASKILPPMFSDAAKKITDVASGVDKVLNGNGKLAKK